MEEDTQGSSFLNCSCVPAGSNVCLCASKNMPTTSSLIQSSVQPKAKHTHLILVNGEPRDLWLQSDHCECLCTRACVCVCSRVCECETGQQTKNISKIYERCLNNTFKLGTSGVVV